MAPHIIIFYASFLMLAAYSITCGGAPERYIAVILLVSAAMDTVIVHTGLLTWKMNFIFLDSVTAIATLVVALFAHRQWPMLLTSFLLLGVELQAGVLFAPVMHRQIYSLMHGYSAYPAMAILFAGVFRHRRRSKQGLDRDWTNFEGAA